MSSNRTPDFAAHLANHVIQFNSDSLQWELVEVNQTEPSTSIKISSRNPFNLESLILKYIQTNYRIILAGPGGCGKNFAKDLLERSGFTYGPSYTSRDIRPGEVDGVDYNFITKSEFEIMINNNEFYEFVEFGGRYYGTTNQQFFETCNLFIMTADGVEEINDEDRLNTIVFYFDIAPEILQKRLIGRGDDAEKVANRVEEDWQLFADWKDYDVRIRDEFFTREQLLQKLQGLIINLEKIYS